MKKLMLLSMFIVSGILAMAQSTTRINQNQKNQSKRISQGVATGELTKKETKQLVIQQKQIQHQKRIAKADGVVTRKEKARLKYNQLKANANIYRKKHNSTSRNL